MDQGRHGQRAHLAGRPTALASYGFSLITTILLLWPARSPSEGTPLGDFRGYFPFDQLSYAAIASSVAGGNAAIVEPFTETGESFYPSAWYHLIGLFARVAGVGVPAAWSLLGAFVVLAMIVVVAWCAVRVSGRIWAAALVGPALWIGPLATAFGGTWFLTLESHAVLWGPYGMYFTLNAEAVGIALGTGALAVAALTAQGRWSHGVSLLVWSLVGATIGLLANIHTYAFLVVLAIGAVWVAVVGLLGAARQTRRIATSLSVGWAIVVAVLAVLVPGLRGNLMVYALMLLAAIPGAVLVGSRHKGPSVSVTVGLVVFSLPQLLLVASGIVSGSPFLAYRQAQSAELGIDLSSFVLGTAPLALWGLAIWIGLRGLDVAISLRAIPLMGGVALLLLSFNNIWGFVQEPYRMWIGTVAVLSCLFVMPTAVVLARTRGARKHPLFISSSIGALALIALSWWNLGGFRQFVEENGAIPFASARHIAMGDLARGTTGLVAADPCIDPQYLKIASRARVAFYNKGIAWPDKKEAIDRVMETRVNGVLDPDALRRADVTHLVTDSSCPAGWSPRQSDGFVAEGTRTYPGNGGAVTLTLWRLL